MSSGRLVVIHGRCHDCNATWDARNAMGLAAQHAKRYKHRTWVDATYVFGYALPEDDAHEQQVLQ